MVARANTFGMRIVLEGSCLGPKEMGSQVALLALAAALADRDRRLLPRSGHSGSDPSVCRSLADRRQDRRPNHTSG